MEPDVSFNRTNGDHIIRLVDQEKESRKKEKNEKIWTMDFPYSSQFPGPWLPRSNEQFNKECKYLRCGKES